MYRGVDGLIREKDEKKLRKEVSPDLTPYEKYARYIYERIGAIVSIDVMKRDIVRKKLDKAGLTAITVEEYVTFYTFTAIICFVMGLIAGIILFFTNIIPGITVLPFELRVVLILPISSSFAALGLYLTKNYPDTLYKRNIEEIERELPDFLRALALEQCMHVKIEESLENIAEGDFGPISKIVGVVLRKTRAGGMTLAEALREVADNTGSDNLATAFKQLAIAVESGANIEAPLWNLSKNADSNLINKLRAYSGKLKGLVAFYITASTVFPAMLGALLVVSSATGMAPIPEFMFYILFGLLFPGINAAIIYYMIKSEPLI